MAAHRLAHDTEPDESDRWFGSHLQVSQEGSDPEICPPRMVAGKQFLAASRSATLPVSDTNA
jgi:hypothetical protein